MAGAARGAGVNRTRGGREPHPKHHRTGPRRSLARLLCLAALDLAPHRRHQRLDVARLERREPERSASERPRARAGESEGRGESEPNETEREREREKRRGRTVSSHDDERQRGAEGDRGR